MSTVQLRKLAKRRIDKLPPHRLQSAVDFIDFLTAREDSAPSGKRPAFAERMAQANRDVAAGKVISAAQLRRKY